MKVIGLCTICHKEILEGEEESGSGSINAFYRSVHMDSDVEYHKKCIDKKLKDVWNKIKDKLDNNDGIITAENIIRNEFK